MEYFGSFLKKNQTDMEFGAIDSSKAVTVEMQHDEKLKEGDPVHIQVVQGSLVTKVTVTMVIQSL